MKQKNKEKSVYVCGPLTELPPKQRREVKRFYESIADLCQVVTGARAFVPHEHYDPINNPYPTPQEVDKAERRQVCELTSCLVVVAVTASWGGGIEVEMAYKSNVPVIILCELKKLEKKKISRLLRGNPAVKTTISYNAEQEALAQLEIALRKILNAA